MQLNLFQKLSCRDSAYYFLLKKLRIVLKYIEEYAILHISTSNGTQYTKVAWYYDANIPYFGLKHSLLFAIALPYSVFRSHVIYVFTSFDLVPSDEL